MFLHEIYMLRTSEIFQQSHIFLEVGWEGVVSSDYVIANNPLT